MSIGIGMGTERICTHHLYPNTQFMYYPYLYSYQVNAMILYQN